MEGRASRLEDMICTDSVCTIPTGMEYYENRLKTFETYPKQMFPDKYQLVRAGFYYTKMADIVICFRCRVKVSSWERHDNAATEHYKWSPNCEYLKMVGIENPPSFASSGFAGHGALNTQKPTFGGFGSLTGANLFSNKTD